MGAGLRLLDGDADRPLGAAVGQVDGGAQAGRVEGRRIVVGVAVPDHVGLERGRGGGRDDGKVLDHAGQVAGERVQIGLVELAV